jgi:hypothetical protein
MLIVVLLLSASVRLQSATEADGMAVGLQRDSIITLAGDWRFQEDPKQVGETQQWFRPGTVKRRIARVPLPWQLAIPELRDFAGTAWYERVFQLPAGAASRRIAFASYGISDIARIWINGQPAGEHRGAQAPFIIDITHLIRAGDKNTITIEASDPPGSFMDSQSLLRRSGLWQDLWIEITGQTCISDVFMAADVDHSRVEARISIHARRTSASPRKLTVQVIVRAPGGSESCESRQLAFTGQDVSVRIPVDLNPVELWELDRPQLYRARVSLTQSNEVLDAVSADFGMRKIEARAGRIYLNGRPIYITGGGMDPVAYGGGVDVNWHLPPPYHDRTDDEIRADIALTKSLGVNLVRIPLRPAPPRLLYWADRMGLMVWQGEPWTLSQPVKNPTAEEYKRWLTEIMLRDRNHPSLVMWELVNEGGGFPTRDAFLRLASELYEFAKQMDETRLILDNSGGWALSETNYIGNHGKSDLDDVHAYPPFHLFQEGRQLISEVRAREDRPVLFSEFGSIPYVYDADKARAEWGGQEPWWINAPPKGYATTVPHVGYVERFKRWKLDDVFADMKHFTQAEDRYYYESLKHQTELMRINPELSGFVAWLFDTAPHPVGAIDYFKEKKVFADDLSRIWTQDLVIVDIRDRRNFWSGERVRADVHLSHFGDARPVAGNLRWWLEGGEPHGVIGTVTMDPGKVALAGQIEFAAPDVRDARVMRLHSALESSGKIISKNYVDIRVFPLADRTPRVKGIKVYGPLSWRFAVIGYDVNGAEPGAPIVASKTDDALLRMLDEGRTVILLIGRDWVPGAPHLIERSLDPSISPFLRRFGLRLALKQQGGHADTFYLKRSLGMFEHIPFRNPMAWGFEKVWPQYVLRGISSEQEPDLIGGAFGNMIRSRALDVDGQWYESEVNATMLQKHYGKGRIIISTFELLENCADDPVATIMLNDLVAYAASRGK